VQVRGVSDPAVAAPGTIRRDLGAINVVMSLLHVSDGPAEARAESELLLAGLASADRWWPPTELAAYLALLAAGPAERRSLHDVRGQLRAQLITALWAQLGDKAQTCAAELVATDALGEPDAGQVVANQAECAGHPLLALLTERFDHPIDLRGVERALTGVGVDLDDWARAVLGTSMYFPPAS
jgi:hypothetical protein